ncbi:Ig-like domain-containing protein [Baekduia sp. Peel2402]|uniref:Ig-like domain-containing protein n=1 Tax=Baekduia sp. Peel2402 TaxID=3458296 RepID=UPI00403EB837
MFRRALLLSIAALVVLGGGGVAPVGAQQVIHSDGPLTDIWITQGLDCQVRHQADGNIYEVYNPYNTDGNCFTGVRVDGTWYTNRLTAGNVRLVSQSATTGSGTRADPYAIVTVLAAGDSGITLRDRTSYVVGDDAFRDDVTIVNDGDAPADVQLGHGMDCYLGASDVGYGLVEPSAGGRTTVACTKTVNNDPPTRIEAYIPIDGGNTYFEGYYYNAFDILRGALEWPNGCICSTFIDNGMAIGWDVTVPAHGEVTRSHLTAFSPQGRIPDPPPQCRDTGAETQATTPVTVDLTCDGIIEGRAVVTQPAHGTLTGDPSTGTLTYTADAGFVGTDTFTFRASNESGPSNDAIATILVYAGPPAPPEPPDEPVPDTPDPGELPPHPEDPATLTITKVDPAIPGAPTIAVGLRCEVGGDGLCVGQVRANGRKVPVVTTRTGLKRVRLAITKRLRERLGGRCRHANVAISAVTFQPGGRAARTRTRTVRIATPGCRVPAVTG